MRGTYLRRKLLASACIGTGVAVAGESTAQTRQDDTAEIGVRSKFLPGLDSSVSLFRLD
jgi:hypothetical protein